MLIRLINCMPHRLVRYAYSVPMLRSLGSRALRPSEGDAKSKFSVSIKQGPLSGKRLEVDNSIPKYYWLRGHDEFEVLNCMRDLVKVGGAVVDIGAHIGIETLMLSEWVGSTGQVLSLEPDPATFAMLRRNCELNGCQNVRLFQMAASSSAGTLSFVSNEGVTSHLARSDDSMKGDGNSTIQVQAVRLDDLLAEQRVTPSLIKVDVEDFEGDVLRGAANLLKDAHPAWVIEIHSPKSARECNDILASAGYVVSVIERPDITPDDYISSRYLDEGEEFQRLHFLAV